MRRASCLLLVLWLGCSGGAEKAKPKPVEVQTSDHKMVNPLEEGEEDGDGMKVEGALGTLDQNAVQAGLSRSMLEFTSCYDRRARRKPYLCGDVVLAFRVTREGKIKKVHVKQSSLGALSIEKCILEAARTASFERPRGGEAEFSYTVSFNARVTVDAWDPGMVREEIDDNRDKLFIKQEGRESVPLEVPSGLRVTMYVNRRGKVISVGMTAEEEIDEEFSTHFISAVKTIQFEKPQSFAKVTITW
jgi:TonB family protein